VGALASKSIVRTRTAFVLLPFTARLLFETSVEQHLNAPATAAIPESQPSVFSDPQY